MGATATALPAGHISWRDNPGPCLITANLFEETGAGTYPKANTTGLFTGADGSHADYPIENLADRNRSTIWQWNGATASTVYLLHDAGAGETFTADCIIWEGVYDTDWLDVAKSPTIIVQASDAVDGGNALQAPTTITTITGAFTDDLHCELWDSSYEARYWLISLDWNGAQSGQHQFSQMWLGRQRQLCCPPDSPHDPLETMSDWEGTATAGGFEQRLANYIDRRRIRGRWWLWAAEAQTYLRSAKTETNGWADPFWFIREPDTNPDETLFGHFYEPGLFLPSDIGSESPPDKWFDNDFREMLPRGSAAGA